MRSRWKGRKHTGQVYSTAFRLAARARARVFSITSQPLGQGERVHGGPIVGRVLRLLRGLLVQVVHGAEGVHGVQRVAVHPVVLHGERPLTCGEKRASSGGRSGDATQLLISGSRAEFSRAR